MAQQNEKNPSLLTNEILYAIFAIFLAVAFWSVGHSLFTGIFFSIWRSEMWFFSFFTDQFDLIRNWTAGSKYNMVTFSQFWDIGTIVGSYTRWLLAPLMIGVGAWVYISDPYKQFSRPMKMKDLVKDFRPQWPFASMYYDENMNQEKRFKTRFRPMKPREFTKAYQLINEDGELDETRAEMAFIRQLGEPFVMRKVWPLHKRAMIAMCLLKYERKEEQYKALRNGIAIVFQKTGRIKGAEKLINEHFAMIGTDGKKLMARMARKHAYESTWFYGLYKASRKGVFPPVEFSWMKVTDKQLWLNLDTMDRRRAWSESSGIRAHWLAEIAHGAAIKTPILGEAIIGLREALAEVRDPDANEDDE